MEECIVKQWDKELLPLGVNFSEFGKIADSDGVTRECARFAQKILGWFRLLGFSFSRTVGLLWNRVRLESWPIFSLRFGIDCSNVLRSTGLILDGILRNYYDLPYFCMNDHEYC